MKPLTEAERKLHRKLNMDACRRSSKRVRTKPGIMVRVPEYNIPRLRKRLMAIEDKYLNTKLRRKAYVCDGGEIKPCNDEGFGNITDAFIARPSTCKYCVFETVDGRAVLINMYELMQSGNTMELTVKEGGDIDFDTVEAAIMYAITIE